LFNAHGADDTALKPGCQTLVRLMDYSRAIIAER